MVDPGTSPYATVHLEELEQIPGPGTLTWVPVRSHFDIRAFGTNAYMAAQPGDDVVEPHREETDDPGSGHQELYFVARGRARFELDGKQIDAPAGTYVFIRDPGVLRYAVAEEAGTAVLSFGGPPTFEPSAWEWKFRAVGYLERGDAAAARNAVDDGLARYPGNAGLQLALAAICIAEGDHSAAIEALEEAVRLDPQAGRALGEDERWRPLAGRPEFERLTGGA